MESDLLSNATTRLRSYLMSLMSYKYCISNAYRLLPFADCFFDLPAVSFQLWQFYLRTGTATAVSVKTPLQAHERMYLQLGGTQFHNDLGQYLMLDSILCPQYIQKFSRVSTYSPVFPMFPLFPHVFPCFPLILPIFPCFSTFSRVFYVSPYFPMFFYVFP